MGQKFALALLVLMALGACKSQKTDVANTSAEAEINATVAKAETMEASKRAPKVVEKPKPSIIHVSLNLKAENGVESVKLDSFYRKDGKMDENFPKITSDEHRLRLIFKSEDGSKKKYYWLRHPLFLKITVPNKDGKLETIEVSEKETTVFFKTPYAEWYHSIDMESFPVKSPGKLIGTVLL